jgi:transposase-like protein
LCIWWRASLNYVNWKERKAVVQDLRTIYHAGTAEEGEQRLQEFAAKWAEEYAPIVALWQRIIGGFAFSISKDDYPSGTSFDLDDIRFETK